MRKLTLCLAYYMNPRMLARQIEGLCELPAAIRDQLELRVCDDGSPPGFEAVGAHWTGIPYKLFRIDVDVRWNQDAARNICAHHARTPWLLLTDMDHLVPQETFERILRKPPLDEMKVYRFSRMTLEAESQDRKITELSEYKPHPNSWLMTRAMYQRIGGYDERFAGHYGTDAEFRNRVAQAAPIEILPEKLWRVPRETIADASTRTYTRKGDPIDDGAIARIRAERDKIPRWRPKNLTFPYRLIFQCDN